MGRAGRWVVAVTATAALAGCVAGEPAGPPVVLLSLSGAGAPVLEGLGAGLRRAPLEVEPGRSTWEQLALLATGDPAAVETGGGLPPRLPGAVTTLAELATRFGHESALFLEGDALTEESGLLQGGFQTLDGPTLALATAGDPGRLAADELLAFVGDKLPRPMEDAPFAWAHLELDGIPPEEARTRVADLVERLRGLFAERPEALTVVIALPTEARPGAVAFSGAGVAPSPGDLGLPLVDLAPTILGLTGIPGALGVGDDRSEALRR